MKWKVKIGADKLLAEMLRTGCTLHTGLIILTNISAPVSERKPWYFSLTYEVKGMRWVSELWICLFWSRICSINWKCLTFPLRCTLGMPGAFCLCCPETFSFQQYLSSTVKSVWWKPIFCPYKSPTHSHTLTCIFPRLDTLTYTYNELMLCFVYPAVQRWVTFKEAQLKETSTITAVS